MPRVKSYGQPNVKPDALPGARRRSFEDAQSLGAGVGEAQAGLGDTMTRAGLAGLDVARQLHQTEQTRQDQVAALTTDRQLGELEERLLRDPQAGALNIRGKETLALRDTVLEAYDKDAAAIGASLNERQRLLFERAKEGRRLAITETLDRHTMAELASWEKGEVEASLSTSVSAAIANATDPRRVGAELEKQAAIVAAHGQSLGLGAEAQAGLVEKLRTETHVGVIGRLLAADQDRAAAVYFEETKDQISGDKLATIEKALEEGTLRGASQRTADQIVAAGGTLAEQRAKVRAIEDPKTRDAVMERIEHEAAVREREERDAAEALSLRAYSIVDQTRDIRKIPPSDWAALPGSVRSSLRSYAKQMIEYGQVETDLPTYYGLVQQAGKDPTAFAQLDLRTVIGKLGKTEFKQLADLQLSLRNGERASADKVLEGFQTKQEIVDSTLTSYGIDPKAKADTAQGKAIAQLMRMLDRRVDAAQTGEPGHPPRRVTNEEIQRTLDGLLSTSTTVPGSWWNIWPGGQSFTDRTARVIETTIADVPASERTQIEQSLRRAGRPVSDATVLDLYIEAQLLRANTKGK
jgi:hypothetical protein